MMRPTELRELNSLHATLLTFVNFGLNTSYELSSQAGLSVGHTIPALRRLEEAGLLETRQGPRKKTEYQVTPLGHERLREALRTARATLWDRDRRNTYESAARVIILAWVYFGREEAQRCVVQMEEDLQTQARRKQNDADELAYDLDRLRPGELYADDAAALEGVRLAKSYQYLKVTAEASLLKLQSQAISQLPEAFGQLPRAFRTPEATLRLGSE